MGSKKITINEIAKKSGVSIATVSRIINGKDKVKEDTKAYVLETIKTLEKEAGLSNTILGSPANSLILIISELSNPCLSSFSEGVYSYAKDYGYHITTLDFSPHRTDFMSEIAFYSKNTPLAGIILLGSFENISDLESIAIRYPMVIASESIDNMYISSVKIDNFEAAKTATKYLISIGRKKIAFVNINSTYRFASHREKGFLAALDENNIIPEKNWIMNLPALDCSIASISIRRLFDGSTDLPNAIFTVNDMIAAVAIKEIKNFGYRVPEDIAVISFDNTEISNLTEPNITTIDSKPYQVGVQACTLLIYHIHNPHKPSSKLVTLPELIIRGSSQP